MEVFEKLKISKPVLRALDTLGIVEPTPIQKKSIPAIHSGKDIVGLAQTGTGKTMAYLIPILNRLEFSEQTQPRVLILVPTRELVLQVVEAAKGLAQYRNIHIAGVYGGANINTQKQLITEGLDVLVATPGRLFDLAASGVLRLSFIQKLVIDEVDEMLFIGFRAQLVNILDMLPNKKQSIMFSATLPENVEAIINDYFTAPKKIEIVPVGTPLEKIEQIAYPVPNYSTKQQFLSTILKDEAVEKALVFVKNKRIADRLFENLEPLFENDIQVIHSNKSQNYRFQTVVEFQDNQFRILIATDIVSRGMDIKGITHVINFDTPEKPEQYIHRIGRTGRNRAKGNALLMFTKKEEESVLEIEILMQQEIPVAPLPDYVEVSKKLMPEEKDNLIEKEISSKQRTKFEPGPAFHEKSDKNKKVNSGSSYKKMIKTKYKKPKSRPPKTNKKKN